MLEIGFVQRSGREQDDAGNLAAVAMGGDAQEIIAENPVEVGKALDLEIADIVRQAPRKDDAVFQDITGAGGRLGAVGKTPPAAIGTAGQIHRIEVEPGVLGGTDALTGELITGISQHDPGGQSALLEQPLGAVKICQHGIEQPGPLHQPLFQRDPFMGRNHKGDGVELPRAVHAAGVAVDIVGDSIFGDGAPGLIGTGRKPARAQAVQGSCQPLVMGTQLAIGRHHLVPDAARFGISGEEG